MTVTMLELTGIIMIPTVGAFAMSSIGTQDQQLAGYGGFDKESVKAPIMFGWALTGITAIIVGLWLSNWLLLAIGIAIIIFGYYWTYLMAHPVFS